jgi:hypothetical protein
MGVENVSHKFDVQVDDYMIIGFKSGNIYTFVPSRLEALIRLFNDNADLRSEVEKECGNLQSSPGE